jgi:hypothetical protein
MQCPNCAEDDLIPVIIVSGITGDQICAKNWCPTCEVLQDKELDE